MLEVIGSGKIELFDADTLRKVEEMPFRNILLRTGLEWGKWHARRDYSYPQDRAYFSGDTFTYARNAGYDARPLNCFNIIGLTDDGRTPAVDEDNQVSPTIAYADKNLYSGSDLKRGTPNYAESEQTPAHTRWVFDWPTSAGNGTFRSIWWYYSDEGLADWPPYTPSDLTRTVSWPVSSNGLYTATYDAATDKVWGTGFDGSGRVGLATWAGGTGTLSFTEIFRMNSTILNGVAIVGSEVFFGDWSVPGRVYVFNKGTSSPGVNVSPTRTMNLPGFTGGQGTLASDGTNLFYATNSNSTVTKFAPTGTVLGSFTVTTLSGANSGYGIVYDPSNDDLLVHQSNGLIARYGAGGATFGQLKSWHRTSALNMDNGFALGGRFWVTQPGGQLYRLGLTNTFAGARTKLSAEVTKSNLQTMKVTYEFDYA